jgi:hypothetical protein
VSVSCNGCIIFISDLCLHFIKEGMDRCEETYTPHEVALYCFS